jgi:N-methylhydantoinase A
MAMRLATDTGGTFTDLAVEEDNGRVTLYKSPTVPEDPVLGVLDALGLAARDRACTLEAFLARANTFIHGTTHAINAIVTGSTPPTALLTTRGHRDILLLREGGRSDPFNNAAKYPSPYVPRALTFEVPERVLYDGSVAIPLDEEAVVEIIRTVVSENIEAVAVCLLWSITNPAHELRIGRLLEQLAPKVRFTLSHQLNPTPREFRRAASASIDASLKPVMSPYLSRLNDRLVAAGFTGRVFVLTNRGGMATAQEAARAPVQVINSGPSVAPVAGRFYALAENATTAIVTDAGGTTYDVGLVRNGEIPLTREMWIGKPHRGHYVGFPCIDMKSIGAGGGSIAWVDPGGLLHVGPQSAGASPGPACYGRGGSQPTVTDAALTLGFLDPDNFLGGVMKLRGELALGAIQNHVSKPLGISDVESAASIMELVTENMVQAIADATVNQGVNPANAVLIAGGGAAGLNCISIARRLGIEQVIIPETGATLSAVGALISDLSADYAAVCPTSTRYFATEAVNRTIESLVSSCQAFAHNAGAERECTSVTLVAEARYENQVWEIDVPLPFQRFHGPESIKIFREAFDDRHHELFTIKDPMSPVEIVALRAEVRCRQHRHERVRMIDSQLTADRGTRRVWFGGSQYVTTMVRQLDALSEGERFSGPTILESALTTVVIDPSSTYCRTKSGSIVITP